MDSRFPSRKALSGTGSGSATPATTRTRAGRSRHRRRGALQSFVLFVFFVVFTQTTTSGAIPRA